MKSSIEYIYAAKTIVPAGVLWGAMKSSGEVTEIVCDGLQGYALADGRVVVIKGQSYNDILGLAKLDQSTLELLEVPRFKTVDEPGELRIGFIEEVLKRGYVVFPLEPYNDFHNKPIIIIK